MLKPPSHSSKTTVNVNSSHFSLNNALHVPHSYVATVSNAGFGGADPSQT